MSENYIVINGKKAELTPEQLKALGIEVKKPSPFDRVPTYNRFYSIAASGVVGEYTEHDDRGYDDCGYGKNAHRVANYCADKDLIQQQAYRETLNRLLWRFSMEHGGACIDWKDSCQNKYYISFEHALNVFKIYIRRSEQMIGAVYFNNLTAAEQAIEEIVKPFMAAHPDFKL